MAKRKLTIGCVLVVVGGNGLGACGGAIGTTDEVTQDLDEGAGGSGAGGWVGAVGSGGSGVGGVGTIATGGNIFIGVPVDGGGFVGDIGIIYPGTGGSTDTGGFGGMGGDEGVDDE